MIPGFMKEKFPDRCPKCNSPKRMITFSLLRARGLGGKRRSTRAYFAECQVCDEAWVWRSEKAGWVNAQEVAKTSKAKATTEEGTSSGKEGIDIGKVY
jgi:hypothetical protein